MTIDSIINTGIEADDHDINEELLIEDIQVRGLDVFYIPRDETQDDYFLREKIHSAFTTFYQVEMVPKNIDTFEGYTYSLDRSGAVSLEYGTELVVSKKRFHEEVDSRVKRPLEGDLVYIPQVKTLFEINFVNFSEMDNRLRGEIAYSFVVQKFQYNHDTLSTNIEDVDSMQKLYAYQIIADFSDPVGVIEEGDELTQIFDLTTILIGKVVSIDYSSNQVTLADISTNNQYYDKFQVSTTDRLDNGLGSSVILDKIYDIDSTLSTADSQKVIPNDPIAINQELETEASSMVTSKNKNWL